MFDTMRRANKVKQSTILRRSMIGTVIFFVLASASAAFSQSKILGEAKEKQPSYGELENFTILSYTDLDGWDQAAEFRVSKDGKHAYISNYQGFSIVDVSDPARPKVISQVKNDPSVQSQYIDVLGNILVINQDGVRDEKIKTWVGGIRLYDVSDPAKPREVGFFKTDVAPGAASMDSGSMKIQNKENSHSSQQQWKVITTTFS